MRPILLFTFLLVATMISVKATPIPSSGEEPFNAEYLDVKIIEVIIEETKLEEIVPGIKTFFNEVVTFAKSIIQMLKSKESHEVVHDMDDAREEEEEGSGSSDEYDTNDYKELARLLGVDWIGLQESHELHS